MIEAQLTMPCGCQVGPCSIGKALELKFCGIHAHAQALYIEVLDIIVEFASSELIRNSLREFHGYFRDDWPEALDDDPRNLARKDGVLGLIEMQASAAPIHAFVKSEHWPAVNVCTACGKTDDEGNHTQEE